MRPRFARHACLIVVAISITGCGRVSYDQASPGDAGVAGELDSSIPADGSRDEGTPDRRFVACQPPPGRADEAELPRTVVDISPPATSGAVISVLAGDDLQAALDAARPGDVLELEAGAEFVGPFVLPTLVTDGYVVIRSSAMAALPPHGARVSPEHVPLMPVLIATGNRPALRAPAGGNYFRLEGIAVRSEPGTLLTEPLVELGDRTVGADVQLHHVVLDRVVILGDPSVGAWIGLRTAAAHFAIVGSHIGDIKTTSAVGEAITSLGSPGPMLIANNTFESSGVSLRFGAGQLAATVVLEDLQICGNHVAKPLAWKDDEPEHDGSSWEIRGLLQLHHVRRALVSGNLFEHAWVQAPIAVEPAPLSEGGPAVVEDVTFAYNVFRRMGDVFTFQTYTGAGVQRARIENNLAYDISGRWRGGGRYAISVSTSGLVERHDTAMAPYYHLDLETPHGLPVRVVDNVIGPSTYGAIRAPSQGEGTDSLMAQAPGAEFTGNVIVGRDPVDYPPGNAFPMTLDAVGFVDAPSYDFRLGSSSPFVESATDGTSPGADFDLLRSAMMDSF